MIRLLLEANNPILLTTRNVLKVAHMHFATYQGMAWVVLRT